MRTEGMTLVGGVTNDDVSGLGLPMVEREDRDVARARREAKRARASSAPWAQTPEPAPAAPVVVVPVVEERFVSPDFDPDDDVEPSAPPARPPAAGPVAASSPEPAAPPAPEPAPVPVAPASARVAAPGPKPKARAPRPVERTARAHPPLDPASIVREYVEDGLSVPQIAARRGHSTATVRRVLKGTPGVELRDDRATKSGAAKKDYDPALVAAVRRLYTGPERLTQEQVADRLDITSNVVKRIMGRYDIPARPPAHERSAADLPRVNPAELMQRRLAEAGVTSRDVRAWARTHDLACPTVGVVPQRLLSAYLRADGGHPLPPDDTDLALHLPDPPPAGPDPEAEPTVDDPPAIVVTAVAAVEPPGDVVVDPTPSSRAPDVATATLVAVFETVARAANALAAGVEAFTAALRGPTTRDDYTLGGP